MSPRVEIRPGPGTPWQPVDLPVPAPQVLAAARLMYPRWQHRTTTPAPAAG